MTEQEINQLRFPIGEFSKPESITSENIEKWILEIEAFPQKMEKIVENLSSTELNYKYKPKGWNIKQVVHHCADSHMNCLIRLKLALTEENPIIRPYFEERWAELPDSLEDNLQDTLVLLKGLHAKLGKVMRNLSAEDLKRAYIHPEHGKQFLLEEVVGTYAWHSNHHFAHIQLALKNKL